MKQRLILAIFLLVAFAAKAGATCTIPQTDSGSQLITDINACLAAGAPAVSGTNGQFYGWNGSNVATAYTLAGDITFNGSYLGTVNHFTLSSNSSAGGSKITNLLTDSTTGDALSNGQSTLNSLSGVNISAPSNGQVLTYNSGVWSNAASGGGGGGYPIGAAAQIAGYNASNVGTAFSLIGDGGIAISGSSYALTVNHFTLASAASAGGFRIASVASDVSTGDALSRLQSTLASLAAVIPSTVPTTPFTISSTALYQAYADSASGGNRVINLPAATGSGIWLRIVKSDTSGNSVTITPNGSDKINGVSTDVLTTSSYIELHDDATGTWFASAAAGGSGGAFPLTSNVSAATFKIQSLGAATSAGDALGFAQANGQLENLLVPNDQSAEHTIGNPSGRQFSWNGMYNVNDPFWNAACPANTASAAETCWQAAYEAACATAASATHNITPWVYVPWGNYTFANHGILRDCTNYIPIIGDGPEFAAGSRITASGNFPVINSATSSEESQAGTLYTANIATGGVANTAHLWQLGSGGSGTAGYYGYDVNSVLSKSLGPAPLNGKGQLGIRFYMNAAFADSIEHGILNSFSLLNNNTSLDLHFDNTSLSFGLLTGSSPGNPNVTATGTISTATNQFVEVDYDGADMCVYAGAPGGTATRGTSQAQTGTIYQLPYEQFMFGYGQPNSSYPMSGVVDSIEMDNQAFHTCASTASFTAPTAKFTTDANTMFLDTGTDSTGALTYANMSTCGTSGTASCWTWPVSYSGGSTNSQYRPMVAASIIDQQQRPTDVENLQISGGNEDIVEDEHPWAVLKNLDLCPSYAGIVNADNNYNATDSDIFIDGYDCGNPTYGSSYGYWDWDGQSFAFLSRLRVYDGAVVEYAGHSLCDNCELDPNGATVAGILAYGANGGGQVSFKDLEWDSENGFTGHPDFTLGGGIAGITFFNGNFGAPTNEPAIQVTAFANLEAHINLFGTQLPASGVPPVNIGSLSHTNQPVYVQGFNVAVDQQHPPLLPGQLCNAGANFTQYCNNTGPGVSAAPLSGSGSTLATTATTDYMLAQGGPLAVGATVGNFETIAGANQTITTVACNFTASNGSGNTDTVTFIDETTGCTTAPTCTASNSASCVNASPGSGLCNVAKGDLIVYSDVTTGTPAARSAFCTAS